MSLLIGRYSKFPPSAGTFGSSETLMVCYLTQTTGDLDDLDVHQSFKLMRELMNSLQDLVFPCLHIF